MYTNEKLAAVLEKRAAARLDRDLLDLFKYVSEKLDINNGPQLTVVLDHGLAKNANPVTLYFILRYEKRPGSDHITSSVYMDQLRAALLPQYRDAVIKEFMDKVDQLDLQEGDE